jgi:hypothetical protein
MVGGRGWTSCPLAARARGAWRRVVALGGVFALAGVVAGAEVVRLAWPLVVRGIVRVLSACERDVTPESVLEVHLGRQPQYTA